MLDLTTVHPLSSTLERIGSLSSYLQVQIEPLAGDGWLTAGDLLAAPVSRRQALMAGIAVRYGTEDRHFVAMTFFSSAMWQVVVAGFAAYLAAERVPDLRAANVTLHWDEQGWADRLALADAGFAVLAGDPDADHPDVAVVADREALRARLLEQLVGDYLPPLVELMSTSSPFGRRVLWSIVADRCAGTIIWLCELLGREDRCREEVDALLAAMPLRGKTGILTVEHGGRLRAFLRRATCCLSYKTPGHDYCATCPLLPIDERLARLRASMAQETAA